ncbi:MAG: hypothetical protein AAGH15_05195 [Myxococcota bacterium]
MGEPSMDLSELEGAVIAKAVLDHEADPECLTITLKDGRRLFLKPELDGDYLIFHIVLRLTPEET